MEEPLLQLIVPCSVQLSRIHQVSVWTPFCMILTFLRRQCIIRQRCAVLKGLNCASDFLLPIPAIRTSQGFFLSHWIFYSGHGVMCKAIRCFFSSRRPSLGLFRILFLISNFFPRDSLLFAGICWWLYPEVTCLPHFHQGEQ